MWERDASSTMTRAGNVQARTKSGEPVIIEKTVTKVTKTTRYISNGREPMSAEKTDKVREVHVEASSRKSPLLPHSPRWTDNNKYEIEVSRLAYTPRVKCYTRSRLPRLYETSAAAGNRHHEVGRSPRSQYRRRHRSRQSSIRQQ